MSKQPPTDWQDISTRPDCDDLLWFCRGDTFDGPRKPSYPDADYWDQWCYAMPPSLPDLPNPDAHGDGYCGCTERCKDRDNCQYDNPDARASSASLNLIEAFEIGFCWRGALVGQSVEDSRAVGRTLESYIFEKLPINVDGFDSFQSGDLGIVEAKKRIHAALRSQVTK